LSLPEKQLGRPKHASECIDSVIPRETTFTDLNIIASLEALDTGRSWKERTIHSHLSELMKRGVIRRLKRATNVSYKVYVRAGVDTCHPTARRHEAQGRDSLRAR